MIIFYIILFLIALAVLFWQACLIIAQMFGSPSVNSNPEAIRTGFKLAKLKNGETVLDLGCGNATSLIIAASEFGARGIGVERSPFYYLLSKLNVLLHGQRKNIQIIFGDFKKAQKQLNNTDVVYLYLLNSALASIEEWFFANLKKGARVVSLAFSFAKHKPSATDHANNLGKETKIELYL